MTLDASSEQRRIATPWRRYVVTFIAVFGGLLAAAYLFVLLIDPFRISPIALPLDRALVTVQRYMYPQIVRSRQFDAAIFGTSTTMLLDPEDFSQPFQARFANLSMASATAWEQKTLLELFLRNVKQPKAVVIGLDIVWCEPNADRNLITFRGFPDWLYDDNRWNDHLHLLNRIGFMSAVRLLRFNVGLFSPTTRADGLDAFLPPDSEYDLERARQHIYGGAAPNRAPDHPPSAPPQGQRQRRDFPALRWLDELLSRIPGETAKVLAFMPTHISNVRGNPAMEDCKQRVAEIGRRRNATVIDWRIPSAITREDSNYWDPLHYRVAVAHRIARDLAAAALSGRESEDGTYRLLAR